MDGLISFEIYQHYFTGFYALFSSLSLMEHLNNFSGKEKRFFKQGRKLSEIGFQ